MKPIKFTEQNCTYAEYQEEYLPLPAYRNPEPEGHVVSCWKLSLKEKIKVLIHGRVYLSLMTFHKPLQPIIITVEKHDIFIKPEEEEKE